MKLTRIEVIIEWSKSEFIKNILIFLNFIDFYRRFVKGFSQIIAFLINVTREAKKNEIKSFFIFIKKAREAFKNFKRMFIITFILKHYN